jgi:tetratricopeptide (TPR) repeat protein
MVTLMQERLISHLWQYVVLLPRKGASLHRFDREVLRRRSEDMGKGALEISIEDGAMRQRGPELVRCPCPEYPDNKMLKDVGLEMQHGLSRLRLASTCFREAADRNPADAEAWNWLATTLLNLEEYAGASKAFSAANSLQPSAGRSVYFSRTSCVPTCQAKATAGRHAAFTPALAPNLQHVKGVGPGALGLAFSSVLQVSFSGLCIRTDSKNHR